MLKLNPNPIIHIMKISKARDFTHTPGDASDRHLKALRPRQTSFLTTYFKFGMLAPP
ncbi:hypothetical protein [Pseudomonas sp. S1(2024)]|uniref:hypothetical protein n=1 Tax=Pseudomonas sp. S1(2024) TaxID=3390191 RepID=UPI0039799B2A